MKSFPSFVPNAVAWAGFALAGTIVAAQELRVQVEVPAGEYAFTAAKTLRSEAVRLPAELLAALGKAGRVDRAVSLSEFPVAPGARQPVVLRRLDVYAPGARVLVIEGGAEPREVPRSRHLHFWGMVPGDPTARIGLSLDPETLELRGLAVGSFGMTEIAEPAREHPAWHRIVDATAASDVPLDTACGTDQEPLPLEVIDLAIAPPAKVAFKATPVPAYSAVIAVDTDNEFHHLKFGNDIDAATDWIADVFVQMNVMYERDLSLRLLQGETFLRIDSDSPPTYDDDPYSVAGSPVSSAQLSEFASYWASNMGAVDRVFAMLLSGKSSSSYSSSGRAYVNSFYCDGFGDYSVTQVFKAAIPAINDVRIVGHELGHNFGSPHTHCYNPPVDQCYGSQGGCYSGAVSCPPGGNGTLMSYCHFPIGSGGADCGSNLIEFHPTVAGLLNTLMGNNTPGCIEVTNLVFDDGFESGNTSGWSSTSP